MRRILLLAALAVVTNAGAAGAGDEVPGPEYGAGYGAFGPAYPGYGFGYPGFGPGYPYYGFGYPGYGPAYPGAAFGGPDYRPRTPGSGWGRPDFRGPSGYGERGTRQGYGRDSEGWGAGPREGRFRPPVPANGANP